MLHYKEKIEVGVKKEEAKQASKEWERKDAYLLHLLQK